MSDQLFKKNKMRKEKELKRKSKFSKTQKESLKIIHIFCEAETEYYYFLNFIRFYRLSSVKVEKASGSNPISIIEDAIRKAKYSSDIDYIYCVFDGDNSQSKKIALDRLNNYKPRRGDLSKPQYQATISVPCFELWFLLHFEFSSRPYHRTGKLSADENVVKELRKHISSYQKGKSNIFNEHLKGKISIAIKNAKRLEKYNQSNESPNPATDVHTLVEYLINLKQDS